MNLSYEENVENRTEGTKITKIGPKNTGVAAAQYNTINADPGRWT